MKSAGPWRWSSLVVAVLAAGWTAVVPSAARGGWSEPSGAALNLSPTANAGGSSIANVGGIPYVAWGEASAGHDQVFVKRLEGTNWVQVGGSLNVDGANDASSPDIASVDGVPYVAWEESNGTRRDLYVKRWTGAGWTLVGRGALNRMTDADAVNPSLASVGGVPYVAWDEEAPGGKSLVFVDRLHGAAWLAVGGGALNESVVDAAQSPKLADVAGTPWVVWSESDGAHVLIHVRRFDGASFVPVGSDPLNLSETQDAVLPSLAVVSGVPYAAWGESDGAAPQIRVARLVGSDWTAVGGSLNVDPAENASAPTIRSIGGVPTVAWQETSGRVSEIRFARLDRSSWRSVGGSLNVDPAQYASFVDPTLADFGGVPYVTWSEANGAIVDVRVKRLEPDILAESATASGAGVTLSAQVDDFGLPLPVGFDYGAGGFSSQTPLELSSGAGISTVTAIVGGLPPATSYLYRAFGSDTFRETSTGVTQSFSTPPVPGGIASSVSSAPVPGRIAGLALRPSRFRAARRGASIAAGMSGTLVSYVDSQAATTTFTVQRTSGGRRAAGRCVVASRRNRGHERCTRYASVGSFTHADAAGPNHFRFTGRVGGGTLAPGRYRLQASPTNSVGRGLPAYRNFEVKR